MGVAVAGTGFTSAVSLLIGDPGDGGTSPGRDISSAGELPYKGFNLDFRDTWKATFFRTWFKYADSASNICDTTGHHRVGDNWHASH
jgi:hypothetical protein